ncbi:MAG: hypothetical protein KDA24_09430 [Deltaproteobacteria bacterium]|nr:hypothetical protein [Deltaproteobacteria bacterium]
MSRILIASVAALACASLAPTPAVAGFDWGGDCSSGSGSFVEFVPQGTFSEVGEIPEGKVGVSIDLESPRDVDIQLIDVWTGTEIIAWPNGLLNGPSYGCTTFDAVEYCWSGYNGDQTSDGKGNESIEINGTTNRPLVMKAFGYQAGDSDVSYAFSGDPTCYEIGEGNFQQFIPQNGVETIGDIPLGKVNVEIELNAGGGNDLDVQLIDAIDGTEIVAWPSGILSGAGQQQTTYHGMTITWSGYNGINGNWGHESIEIAGAVTRPLTMRAFGFQSGDAEVDYEWGDGVGATCGGIAALQCDDGLFCKEWQTNVPADPAGACHTEMWCMSDSTAQNDCGNVIHPMVPGFFSCFEFSCSWQACANPTDPRYTYVATSVAQCSVLRYVCPPNEDFFSNACGCGCVAN